MSSIRAIDWPNPLDLLPDLNPLDDLAYKLKEAADVVIETLNVVLLYRPADSDFQDELLGIGWGWADWLAVTVTILLFILMFANIGLYKNFAHALIIAVTLGATSALFFWSLSYAPSLELWLTKELNIYNGESANIDGVTIILPFMSEVLISSTGLFFTTALAGLMVVGFMALHIVSIGAAALFLPALVLSPIGDGFKKFRNALIAILLVDRVLGVPTVTLVLSIGSWFRDTVPFGDTAIASYLLNAAMLIAAIFAVIGVGYACYKAPEVLASKIFGRSQVSGSVDAKLQPGTKVDVDRVNQELTRSTPMQPLPPPQPQRSDHHDGIVSKSSETVKLAIASGGTPQGLAKAVVVKKTVEHVGNK